MKTQARILAVVFFSLRLVAADSAPSATETFRVVHLHVLQPDGSPAAHRDVELRGFERRALGPIPLLYASWATNDDPGKARKEGWLFTTDAQGNVMAKIGNFAGWHDEKMRPGWGLYIFVVQPGPKDAGATSQTFWSYNDVDPNNLKTLGEWGIPLPLPVDGLNLTMALQTGYTLYGQLLDEHDHRTPVPNVSVAAWNDLHVDTHTGMGGEIFTHGAVTDANGEFKLEHLYFAPLRLRLGDLWMTTNQGGKWVTQQEDVIDPPVDHGLRITCGVMVHSDFHYTGKVTDAQGRPVVNADVVVGLSSEPKAETWDDLRQHQQTKTDAEGHYDMIGFSPWGTFLEAEDPVHGRVDLVWRDSDTPDIPPGWYDLTFPVKSNASK